MIKSRILLIALLLPLMAFNVHKYYLSLHKVEYKESEKTIQISMRIFIDDLQESINATYKKDFELALPKESEQINIAIARYVKEHCTFKINNLEKGFNYLGKEYENDVVYLYLEITDVASISTIEVQNNMLMEKFPEQQHIVKLNIYDKKKTFILTQKNDKDLLKF